MRRTWRLRPSVIVNSIQASGTLLRYRTGGLRSHSIGGSMRRTAAGRVGPSFSVTPQLSAPSAASSGSPSTCAREVLRSEEHTSELQSLMRISYAVFCLKKKNKHEYKMYNTT